MQSVEFDHMKPRRFFDAIGDRQPQSLIRRALRPDLLHIGLVKRTQSVEHLARLRSKVGLRAEALHHTSGESILIFIKT